MDALIVTAFTIGFLGSTHCLGMCGGIVGALNAKSPAPATSAVSDLFRNVAYNAGRITSYALAGVWGALLGGVLSQSELVTVVPFGRIIAGLIMIALGLYIAGWPQLIAPLEKAGYHLWRRIEPMGRRFLPAESASHAFGLGLVWGWLPCGLVYSALALAIASAQPLHGALIMLCFGLGTLPMLLAMGGAADFFMRQARQPLFRMGAGSVIVLLGLYTIVTATGGHHGAHASQITASAQQ